MDNKEGGDASSSRLTLSQSKSLNVIVDKKLYDVVAPVVPMNPIMTLKNVMDCLKIYICTKQLYDPLEPAKIHLENDALSTVFGVSDVDVSDVLNYVRKSVYPIHQKSDNCHKKKNAADDFFKSNSPPLPVFGGSKRKIGDIFPGVFKECTDYISHGASSSLKASTSTITETGSISRVNEESSFTHAIKQERDSMCVLPAKKLKHENAHILSLIRSTSDSESSEGKEYEACILKDTRRANEDYSDLVFAVESTFDVEYEIAESDSSHFSSLLSSDDTDSSTDVVLNSAIFDIIYHHETDIEYLADRSSDDDEISESDKWKCSACDHMNTPFSRYCYKCFKTRTGWCRTEKRLPKRKCKSRRKRAPPVIKLENTTKQKSGDSSLDTLPSTSSKESNNTVFLSETLETKCQNFNLGNMEGSLCFLCCEKPANGTIIHNNCKYAHVIACFSCARRLKKEQKGCPICRRRIDRVVCSVLS